MKRLLVCVLALGLPAFFVFPVAGAVTLTGLSWRDTGVGVEIIVNTDGAPPVVGYEIGNPPQYVVDFLGKDTYCQLEKINPIGIEPVLGVRVVPGMGESVGGAYPVDFLVVDLMTKKPAAVTEKKNLISVQVLKEAPGKEKDQEEAKTTAENVKPVPAEKPKKEKAVGLPKPENPARDRRTAERLKKELEFLKEI